MKRGWVIGIIVLAVLLIAGIIFMIITEWGPAWVGIAGHSEPQMFDNQEYVPRKTVWDLLELLIVPAALALTALWFSNRERKDDRKAAETRANFDREAADKRAEFDRAAADKRAQVDREVADKRAEVDREVADKRLQTEREIATDRLQEATLQAYYDKMTELLLEKNLREAEKGEEIISIARSRTLATLRSLDGNRKGMLIKFLCEVKLIDKQRTIIDLSDADLENADLSFANLTNKKFRVTILKKANLGMADLKGADLIGSWLNDADLSGANLSGANLNVTILSGATLSGADLSGADLRAANLSDADLSGANLTEAYLSEADLSGADLSGIDLSRADLSEAKLNQTKGLSNEQLATVKTLHGAIMLNGKTYDPAIHTEIAKLRKEAGLDDGNTPPENI